MKGVTCCENHASSLSPRLSSTDFGPLETHTPSYPVSSYSMSSNRLRTTTQHNTTHHTTPHHTTLHGSTYLSGTEYVWHEEVHQRPELHQVVLQRSARQQQPALSAEIQQGLPPLRFKVLKPVQYK